MIPEEHQVPAELQKLDDESVHLPLPCPALPGFIRAVLHPQTHAIHISFLRQGKSKDEPISKEMEDQGDRLLKDGPNVLQKKEQYHFLWDPAALSALHQKIWQSPQQELHADWKNHLNQLLIAGHKS